MIDARPIGVGRRFSQVNAWIADHGTARRAVTVTRWVEEGLDRPGGTVHDL
jgi:hypothetical protein